MPLLCNYANVITTAGSGAGTCVAVSAGMTQLETLPTLALATVTGGRSKGEGQLARVIRFREAEEARIEPESSLGKVIGFRNAQAEHIAPDSQLGRVIAFRNGQRERILRENPAR